MGRLQIGSKPDGLDFGVYFLLGFNGLGIIVSNSSHRRPPQRSSALFWWWRSKRITSSLPRGVNRCVAEKKSTNTAVKSKTDLKKMTPAASSRRGQSWLDINWGEDERPATIEIRVNRPAKCWETIAFTNRYRQIFHATNSGGNICSQSFSLIFGSASADI